MECGKVSHMSKVIATRITYVARNGCKKSGKKVLKMMRFDVCPARPAGAATSDMANSCAVDD
jgi:hypothetical protein